MPTTCKPCGGVMHAEGKFSYDEPDSRTTWDIHVVVCADCDAVGLKGFHGQREGVTRLTRDKTPWVAGHAEHEDYDSAPFGEPPEKVTQGVFNVAKAL